ncbi:hypothetical protein [Agreia bicolorata]|uniref:hypothetical protein n=1 Tax=Agreia bicolorata TaxID=110935 RepID=UPI00111673F8|nr:hypothetical protein [Agreia bicolorata]
MAERTYAEFIIGIPNTSAALIEKKLDRIAAELFKLDGGAGARFSADPVGGTLTFGYVIESDDINEVVAKASALTRTALHAAGGNTKGWPSEFKNIQSTQKQLTDA